MPGPNARRIVEQDEAFASPCYIKEYPLVIARGEKAMVEDVDGNRFLDFMAGIAVASTGYGHPKVIAAIKAQADKFLHICGSDFYFEGLAHVVRAAREARAGDEQEARVPLQLRRAKRWMARSSSRATPRAARD